MKHKTTFFEVIWLNIIFALIYFFGVVKLCFEFVLSWLFKTEIKLDFLSFIVTLVTKYNRIIIVVWIFFCLVYLYSYIKDSPTHTKRV